jgi:hypothetical protein
LNVRSRVTPWVRIEATSRAAILDAFKRRHCYAATDNILMDVRCGEHLMGDEFEADCCPLLDV